MADDAAGAVRRTPRPARVPELWWSPTKREVYWLPDPTSVNVWTLELADESLPSDQLPADAVQLVGPDQRRPVVLLRAEDCACPVGGDCPHGPEPVDALDLAVWLHAEAEHRLAEARSHVAVYREERDEWNGAFHKVEAERNLALWLHAEAKHQLDEMDRMEQHVLTAERDALQARLDGFTTQVRDLYESLKGAPCTFWACPGPDEPLTPMATCNTCAAQIELRAALQGDQPDKSKPCKYVVSAWAGLPGSECIAFAEPGEDYCKPHGDAIKRLAEIPAAEPEVTPPDPSGRITDHGPVVPFEEGA